MNVLLDTHTILWFALGDAKLSKAGRSAIEDPANDKFISPASYWEIAIKMSLGKYSLSAPHDVFFQTTITNNGYQILAIEPRHTAALIPLPFHHRDPFDRLLIAQAIVEDMPIVSSDTILDAYPIRRMW